MTASVQLPQHPLTFEEYLAFEMQSSWKHELVGGELHAFAGASDAHNRFCTRLVGILEDPTSLPGCRTYMADMKLRVDESSGYYPDLMVVCDPTDSERYFKFAPCLVVEVLSRSTAATDRREKLLAYRRIPSVGDYLIIAEDRREIEHHQRNADDTWRKVTVNETGLVHVQCVDIELTLERIYTGIVPFP